MGGWSYGEDGPMGWIDLCGGRSYGLMVVWVDDPMMRTVLW